MGFDQPKLVIDAARNLGEEIRRVGVANCRGPSNRFARRLPERRERRSNREDVFFFVGHAQRIGNEERTLGRDLDRSFGDSAEARGAFGQQVGIALRFPGDLVEQLVDRDEGRTPHVPVGLLQLPMQIDSRRRNRSHPPFSSVA